MCLIWDFVAGPIPKAVIVGSPLKKFWQPESTTRKKERPASFAFSSAIRSWSKVSTCKQTLVPGETGNSEWYVFNVSESLH